MPQPCRNVIAARFLLAVGLFSLLGTAGCGGHGIVKPATEPSPPLEPRPSRRETAQAAPGVHHILEKGQTLYALHQAYGVSVTRLMKANGIVDASNIAAGTPIFIPGAKQLLAIPGSRPPVLAWPLQGRVTSNFGPRGRGRLHTGLDIDGETGDLIRAAASGKIVQAKKDGRYGKMLLIDHGQGLRTRYAHASQLLVKQGDRVKRGQPIARVGKTGNASGTHLHFEALKMGRPIDPLPLLKGRPIAHASQK